MDQMNQGMDEEQPMDEEMGGGGDYVIEIYVSGKGNISVSSEPVEAEEAGESDGTPAKTIGEAMKLVMDIYENGGDSGAGDEAFDEGFMGAPVREGE